MASRQNERTVRVPERVPIVCPRSSELSGDAAAQIRVALLTGGFDKHYTLGLATALAAQQVSLDVIGGDAVDGPELYMIPGLRFFNLRGSKDDRAGVAAKVWRVLAYYGRLMRYAASSQPRVFHILWNNKLEYFDRTLLMLCYKALAKKVVFTAHNVNAGKRDATDSLMNRLTLRIQYRLADHIFVHTEKMKHELCRDFGVPEKAVGVFRYPINDSVANTGLTPEIAKSRLSLRKDDKTILFFGAIRPYKGLQYLVDAFLQAAKSRPDLRLIIAGSPKKDSEGYWRDIQRKIEGSELRAQVIQKIEFIADERHRAILQGGRCPGIALYAHFPERRTLPRV